MCIWEEFHFWSGVRKLALRLGAHGEVLSLSTNGNVHLCKAADSMSSWAHMNLSLKMYDTGSNGKLPVVTSTGRLLRQDHGTPRLCHLHPQKWWSGQKAPGHSWQCFRNGSRHIESPRALQEIALPVYLSKSASRTLWLLVDMHQSCSRSSYHRHAHPKACVPQVCRCSRAGSIGWTSRTDIEYHCPLTIVSVIQLDPPRQLEPFRVPLQTRGKLSSPRTHCLRSHSQTSAMHTRTHQSCWSSHRWSRMSISPERSRTITSQFRDPMLHRRTPCSNLLSFPRNH